MIFHKKETEKVELVARPGSFRGKYLLYLVSVHKKTEHFITELFELPLAHVGLGFLHFRK